jgi:hypothetical protein
MAAAPRNCLALPAGNGPEYRHVSGIGMPGSIRTPDQRLRIFVSSTMVELTASQLRDRLGERRFINALQQGASLDREAILRAASGI